MELHFFCPHWGSESMAWETFLKKVKNAGYYGIEWGLHSGISDRELDTVWNLLEKYQLAVIPQHWETNDANFPSHYDGFCSFFERIRKYKAYKINTQTGKDYFTYDENIALVNATIEHTKKTGVPVVHETHRNKFLFAAHIAKEYFKILPDLRITLDISHWVAVAESFLADQSEAVYMALERADHLHARVGHTQGPQVTDPRLSQWKDASETFFAFWDNLMAIKKENYDSFSITPEFGPYPYMALLRSGEPFCNQWDINIYMMEQFKTRY